MNTTRHDACYTVKSGNAVRTYCRACGNPDCPNASADPYFERCPATDRLDPPRERIAPYSVIPQDH